MKPQVTIGAGALVIEQEQVLLVQPNYGPARGQWLLPGGYVEVGETPSEGALRELWEETGQVGRVERPLCLRFRRNPADIYWVFVVNRLLQTPLRVLDTELLDARFWPLAEALESDQVRPMTRYILELATSPQRAQLPPLPQEFRNSHEIFCFGNHPAATDWTREAAKAVS
ncbi:MAG: NUDIX hydrolase [Bdellovibrionales bacterium]|nr:NUDIX hydrolase [Bdellovibrionales bacterium]